MAGETGKVGWGQMTFFALSRVRVVLGVFGAGFEKVFCFLFKREGPRLPPVCLTHLDPWATNYMR